MTKFEFVLNKFYEITAWSLFAAIAMTVLNGDYDTVPASLLWQIPLLSFLGALSSLIYPWAIIFFIISLYSWTKGNREAQKLNQRLKKRNDNES